MTLLLAGPEPSRVLDVRRLERTVLRGVPLVAVPWRVRRSLRRGVELWVDTSESMEPYARDQAELVRGLRGVVGKAAVRVRCFELDPLAPATRQVHWDEGDEPRTMVAGTPVLIVSDFGISRAVARGRPASGQSLAPWTARARERGSRVMGLIPASESAWPATLSTLLTGFEWDRSLSGRALQGRLGARAARRVP